jgi:hypothetical protein
MERLWKIREKQLEIVLINSTHIHGSIEGIAASDIIKLNLPEDNYTNKIEDEMIQ